MAIVSDKESDCEESRVVSVNFLCVDCGTSKTPLWRSGPAGPKSLCNACGVKRNRNKRRALLDSSKSDEKKRKNEKKMKSRNSYVSNVSSNSSSSRSNGCSDSSSKDRLSAMWDVLNPQNVRIEELNEEQQAAVLLMSLSHEFDCY
ncbi:unnamed protein product [Rhodiola kirilowii]